MTETIEQITEAVQEYEYLRSNGTTRKELADWFVHLTEDARAAVRDLMLVDASFMARKNRKGIKFLVWIVGGVATVAVMGATQAADYDAGTVALSSIITGVVGMFFGLLGPQLRLF